MNKKALILAIIVLVILAISISAGAMVKSTQKKLTDAQISKLADNKYADGNLPIGDNKYTTTAPQKGSIYLCNVRKEGQGGGAETDGPWINGTIWNDLQKINVSGSVSWPNATFTQTLKGNTRTLAGNNLPINHTTGVYPVARTDAAYAYDRNPNGISSQNLLQNLPANPTYSETPYCMGGEAGVMLTGVPLFNGFDAELRDAVAHEVQDSCDGHPQNRGQYHYHSLSSCIKDVNYKTVIGYALDGFPITGPKVGENKYLTTEDLDVCHGITSEIVVDGKKKSTYHYVMTRDFPYSVSCFRSKPVMNKPAGGGQQQGGPQGGMPPPRW